MRSGRLDRSVSLLTPAASVDDGYSAAGAPGFVMLEDGVPASYRPAGSNERIAAGGEAAPALAVFEIRWSEVRALLDARGRVVMDGLTFEIRSAPLEIGRRDGLRIEAVRLTNA